MGGTLQEDSVIMELECERANLVLIDRKHTWHVCIYVLETTRVLFEGQFIALWAEISVLACWIHNAYSKYILQYAEQYNYNAVWKRFRKLIFSRNEWNYPWRGAPTIWLQGPDGSLLKLKYWSDSTITKTILIETRSYWDHDIITASDSRIIFSHTWILLDLFQVIIPAASRSTNRLIEQHVGNQYRLINCRCLIEWLLTENGGDCPRKVKINRTLN